MRLGGRNKRPLGERAAHARKYGGKAARKHDRDGLKRLCGKWLLLLKGCRLQQAATWITMASGAHGRSPLVLALQPRGCQASAAAAAASAQQAPVTTRHFNVRKASTTLHCCVCHSPIHYHLLVQFLHIWSPRMLQKVVSNAHVPATPQKARTFCFNPTGHKKRPPPRDRFDCPLAPHCG